MPNYAPIPLIFDQPNFLAAHNDIALSGETQLSTTIHRPIAGAEIRV
jgi:hypothetical protein